MSSPTYKKLIEVAMPVKEVSAESVRDKSIRHGHISTLHLWWARRPLPVCRAVVFSSLVPDPDDALCPPAFRVAVTELLGSEANPGDPYRPYDNIPYTAIVDRMADTSRNRLLMFVGKFSDKFVENEKAGRKTNAKEQLSAYSLVRWESKNDPAIIGRARRLIWVAHNAAPTTTAAKARQETTRLLADYDHYDQAIRAAEVALYACPDRHESTPEVARLESNLHEALEAFLDRMPRVFDPFAGGGAIPLEAARLGCRAFGNDINPVAHIIQRGSLEFPQRFGKPITYSRATFVARYGEDAWHQMPGTQKIVRKGEAVAVRIANRLAFDVKFFAKQVLRNTEDVVGAYYPRNKYGHHPIAYYWSRVGTCTNPGCRAKVPLLKQFYLKSKAGSEVYLKPIISGTDIHFEIRSGAYDEPGWMHKSALKCPCCGSVTDAATIREQVATGIVTERMLAVIDDKPVFKTRGNTQSETFEKYYRLPTPEEISLATQVPFREMPEARLPNVTRLTGGFIVAWGYTKFGQMFSARQLFMLDALATEIKNSVALFDNSDAEYNRAVVTYLGILADKTALVNTTFGRWHNSGEKVEHFFSRQAIPMVFDYPESDPFCESTGSILNQVDWLIRYINEEGSNSFSVVCNNASSGDISQFPAKSLTAVVTDPPYYDAIAYADLSDFFYAWLQRTLGDLYPLNFAYPQTPKKEECTALKHHHNGSYDVAKQHFEQKLQQIFEAIEHQTSDLVSIMFAHQSTEAWTTLCNSILGARMNITGSWAIDTEMANRSVGLAGAALESSVTVSCRPLQRQGDGNYKQVKDDIETTVAHEVEELYRLGFRGADLLTACFGQAVSVFGQYERVEKSDGTLVTVAELLTLARESAFKALLKGFDGDDYTKFYIGWLQLYGFAEADFDDAAKFSRVGLSLNVADLVVNRIFIKKGSKLTLATAAERLAASRHLGEDAADLLLNQAHRALGLYRKGQREPLLRHLSRVGAAPEMPFWRVLTALGEVLPAGADDLKQTTGLLADRDNLLRESKQLELSPTKPVHSTGNLFA